MIRYTVVWHDDVQNELAQVWIDATNRDAVTQAARFIDIHLSRDAASKGTSIADNLRVLVVPPLRAFFAVSEPDRLVKVLYVAKL